MESRYAAWMNSQAERPMNPLVILRPERRHREMIRSILIQRKRVISSSNVEQFASGGVIFLQQGDIVTDLAKDRAKFLNIVFK